MQKLTEEECDRKMWVLAVLVLAGIAVGEEIEYTIGHTRITGVVAPFNGKRIHVFKGIPYAKPPVGERRFKAPEKLSLKKFEKLNATQDFPACMQGRSSWVSEDCLYSVIWVPETVRQRYILHKRKAPVVVSIHGGAFKAGSSLEFYRDGSVIASQEDVIVVGINYRLGVLGFLDFDNNDVPGNMGLMDQQMALKWIYKHIGHFGGDSKRITVIGDSAGSMSISAHILNEKSRKYMHGAIMDGGSVLYETTPAKVQKQKGLKLARELGCNPQAPTKDLVRCLRQKDSMKIVEVQANTCISFWPTYGSKFLPEHPEKLGRKIKGRLPKILLGDAEQEGTMFVDGNCENRPANITDEASALEQIKFLTRSWDMNPDGDVSEYAPYLLQGVVDFLSDGIFKCPVLKFTDIMAAAKANIYLYQMNYYGAVSIFGLPPHAHHIIGYVYEMGTPLLPLFNDKYTQQDLDVARKFVAMVGDFAKQGRNDVPRIGAQGLRPYSLSKRNLNVYSVNAQLEFREGHFRDGPCQRVWDYKIPQKRRH